MEQKFRTNIRMLFLMLALAAGLSACAGTGTPTAAPEAEAPAEAVAVEPWDGDGMDIPLDGSSMTAFETSLARVKAHTTPAEYQGLINAIDYLLIYDVGAKGDREVLASRLDGMTPAEIFKRVNWRRPKPGASPAQADAADANIVDF